MSVSTFTETNRAAQTVDAYVDGLDGNFSVLKRMGGAFAPHAASPPNMTVVLDAGYVFDGANLFEIEAQVCGPILAPSRCFRVDRVVLDQLTGDAYSLRGIESPAPAPPDIPVGSVPVARVLLTPSTTTLTNENLMDERDLQLLGRPGGSIVIFDEEGRSYFYDVNDRGSVIRRSNGGAAMSDMLPGPATGVLPEGWVVTIANNDDQALMSIAADAGASIEGAPLGYLLLGPGQQLTIASDGVGYTLLRQPDRVRLAAAVTTLYVATTGTNSNTGLTDSVPFPTIQKAVDVIANHFDLNGHNVNIQLADGAYTEGFVVQCPWVGGRPTQVAIIGNSSTPDNVLIGADSSTAVVRAYGAGCGFMIRDLKIQAGTGSCIGAENRARVIFENIEFGSAEKCHIFAYGYAFVRASGNYTISGGAGWHLVCGGAGAFYATGVTVTIINTPAFTSCFVNAGTVSLIHFNACAFSGNATGTRYWCCLNAIINTEGGGANFFPGSTAGSTGTGGQYA